jgi:signal transduction histidine kinase
MASCPRVERGLLPGALKAGDALAVCALAATGGLAVTWQRAAARERHLLEVMAEMGRATSQLPDARTQVCDIGRQVLRGDANLLLVPDDGELVSATVSGPPLPPMRVRVDDPRSAIARAFREQEIVFAADGPALEHPALRELGARAAVAAPVTRVGMRMGVCVCAWRRHRRRLTARERRLAEIFAEEKGQAVQRAEMFAQAVDLARAQVRTRLARDLHDSVAQDLAVLGVYAETAARALDDRPEVLAEAVPRLRDHAGKANDEMRELLDTLRVGETLVELGIADLVDGVVADFRHRCRQIAVTAEIPPQDGRDVHPAVRETVYFVLREALHNAATHARASSVRVLTELGPDDLTLVVEDDGRGFDPASTRAGRHGLTGMRERAQLAGGELEIRSAPGAGTTVRLRLGLARPGER